MEDKGLIDQLLSSPIRAINVGVEDFAESLEAQGTEVVHVSWSPPAGGDQEIIAILNQIL
jgi:FdrA protein